MTPRTVALTVTVAAAMTVAGLLFWLSRPSPRPPPRAAAPSAFQPREVHEVTLSDGTPLFDVPIHCQPDDAGSLSCQDACSADSDCPMDHVCAADLDFAYRTCLPPAFFCQDDSGCAEDHACLPVSRSASGIALRRCLPQGSRKAGERCDDYVSQGTRFCEPGLTCFHGLCGPPCEVRRPSCQEGWECIPDARRVLGACLPSCRGRPCPEGQHCRPVGRDANVCLKAVGQDCANVPCPEGQSCRVGFADPEHETAAAECRATCDGKRCPQGQACDEPSGLCYRPCTRDEECSAPERCAPPRQGAPSKGCVLLSSGLPGFGRAP